MKLRKIIEGRILVHGHWLKQECVEEKTLNMWSAVASAARHRFGLNPQITQISQTVGSPL
jgi:hypothetical protein